MKITISIRWKNQEDNQWFFDCLSHFLATQLFEEEFEFIFGSFEEAADINFIWADTDTFEALTKTSLDPHDLLYSTTGMYCKFWRDESFRSVESALLSAIKIGRASIAARSTKIGVPVGNILGGPVHTIDTRQVNYLLCESPIEEQMLESLDAILPLDVCCEPQKVVGPYRLDFAVIKDKIKIAIECDGHDFHERTKEQAARDKQRDRYLQINGWRVLRFSGSEIYRDADNCAKEVLEMLLADV